MGREVFLEPACTPHTVWMRPVGGGFHPCAVGRHYVFVGPVVGGQLDHVAAPKVPGKLQKVGDAGAPEPIYILVIVAHHEDISAGLGLPAQDAQLDAGGVLELGHHQMPHGFARPGGDVPSRITRSAHTCRCAKSAALAASRSSR